GGSSVTFAYDSDGRCVSIVLPNGVAVRYGYDVAPRVLGITYSKGSSILGTLTYAYDAAGSRVALGGTLATVTLPQPLSGVSYNAANQQTVFAGTSMGYDANGNLVSDGVNSYTWNARNQLSSVSGPSTSATFQYDALGRRIVKTIGSVTTRFLYDAQNIVQEQSGGVAISNELTGNLDQIFSRADSNGVVIPLTDALGSTLALSDSNGLIQTRLISDN